MRDSPELQKALQPARLPVLDCVQEDVESVGAALRGSGYEVTSLHPAHPDPDCRRVGLNGIIGRVDTFFSSCEPGDTAFLYLSCHGLVVNDQHYLVPSDAEPGPVRDGEQHINVRTLLPTSPGQLLDKLPPGVTTVVCVDACRNEGEYPFRGTERSVLTGDNGNVVWLYACRPGQRAYADEQGSWFGRMLSQALSPAASPRTIGDVYAYLEKAGARLPRDGSMPPMVDRRSPDWSWEEAQKFPLCDGSETSDRWTEAIEQCGLWQHTIDAATVREPVLEQLRELVRTVVTSRSAVPGRRADPWDDPGYLPRVLERLADLVEHARLTGDDRLSAPETVALLAAPVLHEGVVAVALDELDALMPDGLERSSDDEANAEGHPGLVRQELRDICRAHRQVHQAAETLRSRDLGGAARAADHWLRHRFIADWDPLWERSDAYPSVNKLVDKAVAAVRAAGRARGAVQPSATIDVQLRQVIGHFSVRPGGSPRINEPDAPEGWNDHPPLSGTHWRGRALSNLLWSAALLAVDTRMLSSVLVDHLAAHKRLLPADVVVALHGLSYEPVKRAGDATQPAGGRRVTVCFRCPHPALHSALEDLAGRADQAFREIHRHRTGWHGAALLQGLPYRVTTGMLTPLNRDYTAPLERFRLAEDEIRPLLMGTQLYGDRMLAVRELYQNALDACRYREMRHEYGKHRRMGPGEWEGRISFRQGVEDGRPYIECEDNGAGMTRDRLTSMFARAGRRYEQDPDFVQERRDWRRAGLENVRLNSRFGIGVFSYFMLAEEVTVLTCPVDEHGEPDPRSRLRADIQSGSGLLQIRDDSPAPRGGGTIVRLYLSPQEGPPPSVVETLEELLWVSDYEVTATEEMDDGRSPRLEAEWLPRRLRTPRSWPGDPVPAHTDAWFVQGDGQLLLDGVVVKDAPKVCGYIFNLREKHQPVPSVDRNRLLNYDRDRVRDTLLQCVSALSDPDGWQTVDLAWLWDLAKNEPRLVIDVVETLKPHATASWTPEQTWADWPAVVRVPLRRIGCLPCEGEPALRSRFLTVADSGFERWRLALRWEPHPAAFSGYPPPHGLDAVLFLDHFNSGWSMALEAAARCGISIGTTVRHLRRFAIAGVHVPAAPDIAALREYWPDETAAELHAHYRDVPPSRRLGRTLAPIHAPLVLASARWGLTLRKAADHVRTLIALGVKLPQPPELGGAGERVILRQEAELLLGESVPPAKADSAEDSARAAFVATTRSVSQLTAEQLDPLLTDVETLGFDQNSVSFGRVEEQVGRLARRVLSQDLDGLPEFLTSKVSVAHVLRASAGLSLTVGEVLDLVEQHSAVTGITAPYMTPNLHPWRVPYWLVGAYLRGEWHLGPWHLLFLLINSGTAPDPEEVDNTFARLEQLKLMAPGMGRAVLKALDVAQQTPREILSRLASMVLVWESPASAMAAILQGPHLVSLAERRQETLRAAREEVLEDVRAFDLPMQVVEIPESLAAVQPLPDDRTALFTGPDQYRLNGNTFMPGVKDTFTEEFTMHAIVAHALGARSTVGASARRLAQYAALGAPDPPGHLAASPPGSCLLDDWTPQPEDREAFGSDLLGSGTLGPLELMLTAARFGRTLQDTFIRYTPFKELGLEVAAREPDEDEGGIVPDWRDVVILTEHLTGRSPALAGAVPEDHIQLCSEETDLTPGQVRERLRRYASLFGLEVPEGPEGEN